MNALPDWITAASTAATAIAAFATGLIALLSYRRQTRLPLPIIEPRFQPYGGSSAFMRLDLVVRNRLDESLNISTMRLLHPKGATFASPVPGEKSYDPSGVYVSNGKTEHHLSMTIEPRGTIDESQFAGRVGSIHLDASARTIYLAMPLGWDGKAIEFELHASSAALTIRDKRIVVKRHVNAAPNTQTEAKASNQA